MLTAAVTVYKNRRRIWWLITAILLPIVVLIALLFAAVGGNNAQAAPVSGCTNFSGGPVQQVSIKSTRDLTPEQLKNAGIIIGVGRSMNVPRFGLVVSIATALQESTLHNLSGGDRDSVGLFQQRPSQGWGTVAQISDPTYASRRFFESLLKIAGWQSMPLTVAAQSVQHSGFPDAYAKWQSVAEDIVNNAAPSGTATSQDTSGSCSASSLASINAPLSTGNAIAKVAHDLVASRPPGTIVYSGAESGFQDDPDTTPNPTSLDCSSLVDWVFYHSTGGKHLFKSGGRSSSGTIWSQSIIIPVDLAKHVRGAALFIGPQGNEHIGVSLGDNTHVAAHMRYPDPKQDVTISPIDSGGGFDSAGLLPGIDYSAAATTKEAAAQLASILHVATTVS